jgi:hypothetical protein
LARKHYIWPGLSTDIAAMINNCDKCQYLRPSRMAEPLQCQAKPLGAMQSVSFDLNEDFNISVGLHLLSILKSSTVIKIADAWFHGVGFTQYVYLDSGPKFNAAKFKDYRAKHFNTPLVSSACFPPKKRASGTYSKKSKILVAKVRQLY